MPLSTDMRGWSSAMNSMRPGEVPERERPSALAAAGRIRARRVMRHGV
ncbi:hypothetical protein [Cohnella sp. REN36]|nr:hypothetical protein [Cohnella sp. REN36]MCC3373022.1 hypothetical protein [Cohnella sp. REN36]